MQAVDVGKLTITNDYGVIARAAVQLVVRPLVVDASLHLYGGKGQQLAAEVPVGSHLLPPWRHTYGIYGIYKRKGPANPHTPRHGVLR